MEKAGVQQMQYGVLYTPYVLIDRQPVISSLIHHAVGSWRTETCKVPAGFEKCIEGIGLSRTWFASAWNGGVNEVRVFLYG